MLSLRSMVLLAMLICGITYESRCTAQENCLQYPLYEDDSGTSPNYLYISDDYDNDTACDFLNEGYVWYPNLVYYEACGTGTCQLFLKKLTTGPAPAGDMPLKIPPAATFTFGKTYGNKPLPQITVPVPATATVPASTATFSPSDGIWVNNQPRIVTVVVPASAAFSTTRSIPVKLYSVTLDYQKAGLPSAVWPKQTQIRHIYFGMEVASGTASTAEKYLATFKGARQFYCTIEAKEGNDAVVYHVVTNTQLQ